MKLRWQIFGLGCVCCLATMLPQPACAETESEQFQAILELAGVGPDALATLGPGPDYSDDDWRLLLQVFGRLQQFRDPDPAAPYGAGLPTKSKDRFGGIVRVGGLLVSMEKITLPGKVAEQHNQNFIYRCQLRFLISEGFGTGGATVLATYVPKDWGMKKDFNEGVNLRGVVIQYSEENGQAVIMADHLAWYPDKGVSTGRILLARQGMDVSLLDEVRHRQPFVKPEVSREGEAFYAALTALVKTDPAELKNLARENVGRVAEEWRGEQTQLTKDHQGLKAKLSSTTDEVEQKTLQQQIKQAKKKRGLAAAVLQQAKNGRSSVAPMFLQPEAEVGELIFIEGTARRAIRIATERSAMEAYYELEVFTSDSQNLPIVCCVARLPEGFPTGDEIREPVRLAGVFFKLWRYRSRKPAGEPTDKAGGLQQLYTPVVLGQMPTWLNETAARKSPWALWGGVVFLGALGLLWISMMGLARRDRRARALLRLNKTIDL